VFDLHVHAAQGPLRRAAVIVLDEATIDTRGFEFSRLPRLHEKTAGIGEHLWLDEDDVGDGCLVKFHG